jgi:hypothetical protein
LTSGPVKLKIPPIPAKVCPLGPEVANRIMTSNPVQFPREPTMAQCKHPRVQIVAREEDTEFVECLECREVFESSEFKDMTIEETKLNNES